MSEINGFVKLSSGYIWDNGATILARIDEKRAKKKEEIISENREILESRNCFQKLFNIPKKTYTDGQVWNYFEKYDNRLF